ncbi:MAG: twin-arginine translocase TatA/TatE family subunit [Paludibacteraceae bacterium]|nr:twin-arginine translocase TatA/TatE family subunit [Paludibacteraceae bacterium]
MHTLLMIGAPEIIFIAVIILLLFGGKKIPELMKGIGKGVRSFKEGMNNVEEEIKKPVEDLQPIDQEQQPPKDEPKQ